MVATFPWDPPQAESGSGTSSGPNATNKTATTSANGGHGKKQQQHQQLSSSAAGKSSGASITPTAAADGGVRIKTEPDVESSTNTGGGGPSTNAPMRAPPANADPAAQRAASLLQQKFGSQANESIGAMQSGQNKIKVEPGTTSSPAGKNGVDNRNSAGGGAGQTDGAGEMSTTVEDEWKLARSMGRAGSNTDEARKEREYADDLIRRHVEERGLAMEGGGLMLPLREHAPQPRRGRRGGALNTARRGAISRQSSSLLSSIPASSSSSDILNTNPIASSDPGASGFDGTTDGPSDKIKLEPSGNESDDEDRFKPDPKEEEKDEDAINSDLDDPEEEGDPNGEDEEGLNQIMLCMYDKVQRTKNKWKCVLKDGVLTVGGKEYVFQKANGEFEW